MGSEMCIRDRSYKVGGGCILTLCPPMTITEGELNEAFDIIEAGIKEVS